MYALNVLEKYSIAWIGLEIKYEISESVLKECDT